MPQQKRRLPNVHPGEVLDEEFLRPLGISRYRLAMAIAVPATRVAEICSRRRAITADTALRLGLFFEMSPKFWLGLQEDYDIEEAQRKQASKLATIVPLRIAAAA